MMPLVLWLINDLYFNWDWQRCYLIHSADAITWCHFLQQHCQNRRPATQYLTSENLNLPRKTKAKSRQESQQITIAQLTKWGKKNHFFRYRWMVLSELKLFTMMSDKPTKKQGTKIYLHSHFPLCFHCPIRSRKYIILRYFFLNQQLGS